MTLQAKLVISFTVLLLAVVAAVGIAASQSIESILVAQTDRTLTSFVTRGPDPRDGSALPPPPPDQEEGRTNEPAPTFGEVFLRPFAEMLIDSDGTVIRAEPSGFADEPDPLPDVTELSATSGLVFLDSVGGDLRYRAII